MIQLITGEKGKGKTKILLEKANSEIKSANGNFVYLDKSAQHMYELNNRIRLIDVTTYPVKNTDEFIGFVCGIISQDHDLETMYLDSFLKLASVDETNVAQSLEELDAIGKEYEVNFVISISLVRDQIPENYRANIITEL